MLIIPQRRHKPSSVRRLERRKAWRKSFLKLRLGEPHVVAQRVKAIELMWADPGWVELTSWSKNSPEHGRLMSKSGEQLLSRDIRDGLKARQYLGVDRTDRCVTGKRPGGGRGRSVLLIAAFQTKVKVEEPQAERRRQERWQGQGMQGRQGQRPRGRPTPVDEWIAFTFPFRLQFQHSRRWTTLCRCSS